MISCVLPPALSHLRPTLRLAGHARPVTGLRGRRAARVPHWPFQMIRPWSAEFAALLGEQAAYLVHAPEVAVAEALQPVADFWFELEVIQAPYLVAHDWSQYLPVLTLSPRCWAYALPATERRRLTV